MPILVDSNVIIDIVTEDSDWMSWSSEQLEVLAESDILVINPIIYAEVSLNFDTIEALDNALPEGFFRRLHLPWEAAFLAAKCFVKYRRGGGNKRAPLPDFYIGAHAAISGYSLISRDKGRYQTYFPTVNLICP